MIEDIPDLTHTANQAREVTYSVPEADLERLRRYELSEKAKLLEKPEWLAQRIGDFQVACEEGEKVFWERGSAYGDATAETGLLGAAITLTTDVARLRGILLNLENLNRLADGDQELKKKLRDALIDAHNYACICLHWLDAGNLMGRPNYE